MPQHMFQDPAGTIPAILPGQPVGLVVRQAGLQDASQATALSKPTLARHPKSGVRILGARNVFDNLPVGIIPGPSYSEGGLTVTGSINGLTVECLGKGFDGGVPYADFHVYGVSTASVTHYVNFALTAARPAEVGVKYTTSLWMKSLRPPAENINADLRVFQNFSAPTTGTSLQRPPTLDWTRYSVTGSPVEGQTVFSSRGSYLRVAQAGDAVDVKLRVGGLQTEVGEVATPLQIAYNANNITEAGIPDFWHLYNDGGDSLNAVYPAGTYGRVSCGIDLVPVFDTFVSDGTTPINTLRHERQAYHNARLGVFSETEMSAMRKWIQEKL